MSVIGAFQPLTSSGLAVALSTTTLGRSLHILDQTPSTNTAAMELGQNGAPDGTVVIAETQTSGRGRLGRLWYSPPGKNLYASILLRRTPVIEHIGTWLGWAPLLSAVAVVRAIQVVTGLRPTLKWPNDILFEERKMGGLLCESSGIGTPSSFVVVGIGLNVNMWRDAFPDDLCDCATSLASEAGRPFDRIALMATILSEMELRYDAFFSHRLSDLHHEYELRCSTIGRQVRADLSHGAWIEGYAESLAADGSLRVRITASSEAPQRKPMIDLRSGDVTHLRPMQSSV